MPRLDPTRNGTTETAREATGAENSKDFPQRVDYLPGPGRHSCRHLVLVLWNFPIPPRPYGSHRLTRISSWRRHLRFSLSFGRQSRAHRGTERFGRPLPRR